MRVVRMAGVVRGRAVQGEGAVEWVTPEGAREVVPLGLWTRMERRGMGEGSCSIQIDEADDEVAAAVGVEGADGYKGRRSRCLEKSMSGRCQGE